MSCEKSAFSDWSTGRDVKLPVPNKTMQWDVAPKQRQQQQQQQQQQ